MSVRWLTIVWEDSQAEGRTLLVLLALADHANQEGVAWPTLRGLARKARCTRQTVIDAIRWLEKHGELRVDRGGGRNRRNRYLLFPESYPNGLPARPRKRSTELTTKWSIPEGNGLPLNGAAHPHTPNRHTEPSVLNRQATVSQLVPTADVLRHARIAIHPHVLRGET